MVASEPPSRRRAGTVQRLHDGSCASAHRGCSGGSRWRCSCSQRPRLPAALFNQLISGAPLLENVWDRATDVGLSVTDAGYTVTLEKAAVDSDRVWVALSVTSESGSASIWDMRVTDAAGVAFTGGTGAGTGEVGGQSATLFGFQVPDGVTPTGPFVLEVTALGDDAAGEAGQSIAGTWRFSFDASLTPTWSQPPAQVTPAP